jgi:hypothetical protein
VHGINTMQIVKKAANDEISPLCPLPDVMVEPPCSSPRSYGYLSAKLPEPHQTSPGGRVPQTRKRMGFGQTATL